MRAPSKQECYKIELNEMFYNLAMGLKPVMEAVQKAIIASQPPMPIAKAGGVVNVAECGKGEIATLPDGSKIIPNDIAKQIAKNSNIKIKTNFNLER